MEIKNCRLYLENRIETACFKKSSLEALIEIRRLVIDRLYGHELFGIVTGSWDRILGCPSWHHFEESFGSVAKLRLPDLAKTDEPGYSAWLSTKDTTRYPAVSLVNGVRKRVVALPGDPSELPSKRT